MEYAEQMLELYHKLWIFCGLGGLVLLAVSLGMFFRFHILQIWRKRHWIFLLAAFLLAWQGVCCKNPEVFAKEEEREDPMEEGETSEEAVDTEPPEIHIFWRDEQGKELEDYYQAGRELVMELEIREKHLDGEKTRIYIEARDAAGNTLDIEETRQINGKNWGQLRALAQTELPTEEPARCWELYEEDGEYRFMLRLNTEARYHIWAQIQDASGNVPEGVPEGGTLELGNFCLDRRAPDIPRDTGILLEARQQTFLGKLLHQVTFGYFCQPVLKVRIQAFDEISGVGGITYICEGVGEGEIPEPFQTGGRAESGENLICEENGSRAWVDFSLPVSFRGTIRARAWDLAGHQMEEWTESTGILIESEETHKKSSRLQLFLSEEGEGKEFFFREDVNIRFEMADTFSGIRSFRIRAGTEEKVQDFGEAEQEAVLEAEETLVLSAAENNRNHILISAEFTDFAGYVTELTEIPALHIDTQPPKVQVEWMNQDVQNEKYYRESQTAHIMVRERNFVPDKAELMITGMENPVLSWTHQAGEGCTATASPQDRNHSDACIWESQVVFQEDGLYTFGFTCEDAAGNRGAYEKTDTFVIDQTPPVLEVHWDNSEPQNECYYAEKRSAVLEVRDKNFRPEDLETHVEVYPGGQDAYSPDMGNLRQWEEGSWRAGITFEEDGQFRLKICCRDLAGNEAVPYESEEFVIDQTPPEVIFENVADCSANRGAVAPILHVRDRNFNSKETRISFKGSNGTGQTPAYAENREEEGITLMWGDFEHLPQNDDLYRIQASAQDLAGNVTEAELIFSVNRFGSVYELEEDTAKLAGPGGSRYAATEPELVITEYNPDFLDYYQITCNREGETAELQKGRDYQVEEAGARDTWKTYRYRIGKENFQKEGIYVVTLYSEDRAKNASNNQMKKKSLEFIVDKTGPGIVIHGVRDRERIAGSSVKIRADLWDAFPLKRAEIYVNGICVSVSDAGTLEKSEGTVSCQVPGSKTWQTLVVKAWDQAGNMTETKAVRFLVTDEIRFQILGTFGGKKIAAFLLGILLLAAGLFLWLFRFRRKRS